MAIKEVTLKRLLMVKLICQQGEEHKQQENDIGNMLACHHYHMAIELLLRIVATESGTNLKKIKGFEDLWDKVDECYKLKWMSNLPLKQEILSLKDSRNLVQHSGAVPSNSDLQRYAAYTESFLDNVMKTVFGSSLSQLDTIMLIKDQGLRREFEETKAEIANGNYDQAIGNLGVVFRRGKNMFLERTIGRGGMLSSLSGSKSEEAILDDIISDINSNFDTIEDFLVLHVLASVPYMDHIRFQNVEYGNYFPPCLTLFFGSFCPPHE